MIDVIDLRKSYGRLEVLKGITVTIKEGEKIAIIGPSGSGKSTFLRCLNCLEDPTGGSIIFEGVDIADMRVDINIHRRHMGMVFQQFNLFNNKTVIDNIMLAPVHTGISDLCKKKIKNFFIRIRNLFAKNKKPLYEINTTPSKIKEEARVNAMRLLRKIGLEDKANAYPSTLSGGQKQRIAIIRALAMNPKLCCLMNPHLHLIPKWSGKCLSLSNRLPMKA